MRLVPILALPLMVAASAAVSQPAPVVQVQVASFRFTPSRILLDHGRHYVLSLSNVSGSGHDFSAPAFFAAASVAPADRGLVMEGEVDLPPHQSRLVHFVAPAPGRYKLKCTHSLHKMLGMSGTIIVR